MFCCQKGRLKAFFIAFLVSIFIHSLLFFLPYRPASSVRAEKKAENSIISVEYPMQRQIVTQKTFNKVIPQRNRLSQSGG